MLDENKRLIMEKYKNDKRKIIFQINGDFNSKHLIWGSSITDDRGLTALDWIARNNLHIINDGSSTRINPHSKTNQTDF